MARRSPQTFAKRLREHKREEKNRAKQEKRDQRKASAGQPDPPLNPFDVDLDDGDDPPAADAKDREGSDGARSD